MTFNEQLVKKNKSLWEIVLIILTWIAALGIFTFLLYFAMGTIATSGSSGVFFLVILIGFGLFWGASWITKQFYIEYEYHVFEGGLDIDKITGKSRRVRIVQVSAAKIEELSPISAYDSTKKYDRIVMTASRPKEATWYITYHSKANGHTIVFFSPEEELWEALYKDQSRAVQVACDKLRLRKDG